MLLLNQILLLLSKNIHMHTYTDVRLLENSYDVAYLD